MVTSSDRASILVPNDWRVFGGEKAAACSVGSSCGTSSGG